MDEIKDAFGGNERVRFVGQFVGAFSLFARVVAHELSASSGPHQASTGTPGSVPTSR